MGPDERMGCTPDSAVRSELLVSQPDAQLLRKPAGVQPALLVAFSTGVFVSALLLFLVQPMVGKMFLPLLGGSPNVWNTCVLFFQVTLLAGYSFAHIISRKLSLGRQFLAFFVPAALALIVLPVSVGQRLPPGSANPVDWLSVQLALTVGLPFFVLSAVSPLLQRWFSLTSHPDARDPYFLYASSNTGSLAALLAYPVVFEIQFSLSSQSVIWTSGYFLLLALLGSCILLGRKAGFAERPDDPSAATGAMASPTVRTHLFWLVAAFLPSSLMLAATTAISTNVAPVPFMWVLPLGLYLMTFIFSFLRRSIIPHGLVLRLLPVAVLLVAVASADKTGYRWMNIWSHLLLVFLAGLFCHRELAIRRPAPRFLTQFYLEVAAAGAFGGVFNAIVAPLLFNSVAEYPLVVLMVSLFCAASFLGLSLAPGERAVVGAMQAIGLVSALHLLSSEFYGIRGNIPAIWTVFGLPLAAGWLMGKAARIMTVAVLTAQLGLLLRWSAKPSDLVTVQRNFFGVKKVTSWHSGRYHTLTHGDTSHGLQSLEPHFRMEPLAYYYRNSPLGEVIRVTASETAFLKRVAVLGLGIGTIAAYGEKGQQFDFYEIDADMEQIARNPLNFTFLTETEADVNVILGDARLRLAEAPDGHYQLIVADAFSSDSVPTHLLTVEALELMLRKISPTGLILFHTSNRYVNLHSVLAKSAAELQLLCYTRTQLDVRSEELSEAKYACSYVVIARKEEHLRGLQVMTGWRRLQPDPSLRLWTDDYSSLFPVLRFR